MPINPAIATNIAEICFFMGRIVIALPLPNAAQRGSADMGRRRPVGAARVDLEESLWPQGRGSTSSNVMVTTLAGGGGLTSLAFLGDGVDLSLGDLGNLAGPTGQTARHIQEVAPAAPNHPGQREVQRSQDRGIASVAAERAIAAGESETEIPGDHRQ
ncbi:hypothetical protein AB4Z46_04740 [Variovorax sp. M-6]|uniref:hypothetical protein n=1 Tax=Variovorax sp. M-6 TaxID=3233041 RepID=UPI003F98A4FC